MSASHPYRLVVVASMARAGSMWTYNVIRRLLAHSGAVVLPERVPVTEEEQIQAAAAAFAEPARGSARGSGPRGITCVKTHLPLELPPEIRPEVRIVTPYRDVRDAMLSYMRFTHCDFARGLDAVRGMMQLTDTLLGKAAAGGPNGGGPNGAGPSGAGPDGAGQGTATLGLKYEEMTGEPRRAIAAIANFLGVGLDQDTIADIDAAFSRDAVKRLTEAIGGAVTVDNLDGSQRRFDPATGFQSAHITSDSGGGWRETLDESQQRTLNALCRDWLRKYGYAA